MKMALPSLFGFVVPEDINGIHFPNNTDYYRDWGKIRATGKEIIVPAAVLLKV